MPSPKNPISIYFDPKYLENTLEISLNQSIITKGQKTAPKPEIHPEQKFFPS
jgi:hypothetical protein